MKKGISINENFICPLQGVFSFTQYFLDKSCYGDTPY